jgi:hypothetical protein
VSEREIEALTEQEHAFVTRQAPNHLYAKLVRIHDQQVKRIAELEAERGQLTRNAKVDADEWRGHVLQLEARIAQARALAREWIDDPDSAMSDDLGAALLEALE